MGASIFIARIIGPCYLIVGIGLMFNREFYRRVMDDYAKNAALVFFTGFTALVIGIVIVLLHNVWVANWTVLITLFGWGGIIKGTWLTVFPSSVAGFTQRYARNAKLLMGHSVLAVVLGAVFTYLGYFALTA